MVTVAVDTVATCGSSTDTNLTKVFSVATFKLEADSADGSSHEVQDKDEERRRQEDKTQNIEAKAQSAITRVAESLASFIDAVAAERTKNNRSEQEKLRREKLTRAVAVVGAVIASGALITSVIQVRTSHEALYAVQRAFIALSQPETFPATVTNQGVTTEQWLFTLNVSNAGATTARQVQAITNIVTIPHGDLEAFGYVDQKHGKGVTIAIAPRGAATLGPRAVLRSDIEQLDNRDHKDIIYWGTIQYIDVFDTPHRTEFCVDYTGTSRKKEADAPTPSGIACPSHNCVDEDCPNYKAPITFWQRLP